MGGRAGVERAAWRGRLRSPARRGRAVAAARRLHCAARPCRPALELASRPAGASLRHLARVRQRSAPAARGPQGLRCSPPSRAKPDRAAGPAMRPSLCFGAPGAAPCTTAWWAGRRTDALRAPSTAGRAPAGPKARYVLWLAADVRAQRPQGAKRVLTRGRPAEERRAVGAPASTARPAAVRRPARRAAAPTVAAPDLGRAFTITNSCEPAGTTRTAAAPAWACSPCAPCG